MVMDLRESLRVTGVLSGHKIHPMVGSGIAGVMVAVEGFIG